MLKPWRSDAIYRDDRGYEVVTDVLLYRIYNVPGSLALLLTALGLLGALGLPSGRSGSVGRILTYIALALAVLNAVGVGAQFDPLFTAPRIFGTLALGAATFLAGVDACRTGAAPGWTAERMDIGIEAEAGR